jgi:hypothetical protein
MDHLELVMRLRRGAAISSASAVPCWGCECKVPVRVGWWGTWHEDGRYIATPCTHRAALERAR